MRKRKMLLWVAIAGTLLAVLNGYPWPEVRPVRSLDDVDVWVRAGTEPDACSLERQDDSRPHAVRCSDVARYLREDVHLDRRTLIGISSVGSAVPPDVGRVEKSLEASGYRVRVRLHAEPPHIDKDS